MEKKTYIIADLKLFNEIQRARSGYPSFQEMNEHIIHSWNKVVKEQDSVIILGNVGEGTYDEMKSVISRLNGKLTIVSKHINEVFTKKEWREIGISFFWNVPMFNKLPDGREVLYAIETIKDIESYKKDYALIAVDGENPINGDMPIKDIMISVDALRWGYTPLNTNDLLDIYDNMRTFEQMESTETRSDVKPFGEE